MQKILFMLAILTLSINSYAVDYQAYEVRSFSDTIEYNSTKKETIKKKKWVAATLIVLAGPLGLHRLYLGTHAKVPVSYALTLGGGCGILPVIDLVLILTTKDLSKYEDSHGVFIWNK